MSPGLPRVPDLPSQKRKLRILDWDIENRPLTYLGGDWTTAEITAIAASWVGEKKVHCWLLGEVLTDSEGVAYRRGTESMLLSFCALYEQADMVTGHYIRKHDLPILNGALMEAELPLLGPKLTCDTKLDLVRRKDLSASQEALAGMYGLPQPKHHMSQPEWREANRLTAEGIAYTKKRVVDDVVQHKALRERLIEAGALRAPKVWHP